MVVLPTPPLILVTAMIFIRLKKPDTAKKTLEGPPRSSSGYDRLNAIGPPVR